LSRLRLIAVVTLVVLLAACGSAVPTITAEPVTSPTIAVPTPAATPTDPPAATPEVTPIELPSPSPSPPAIPPTGQVGLPSAGCVEGWQSPPAGSQAREEGIELLALEMGLTAPPEVVELRYFRGPDVPWIIEPHYPVVERWYIRARAGDDPAFAGRWLLERRAERIRGISAVAPFDSTGFESPAWIGFVGDGPPVPYEGLPGLWAGIPYDFVTGEGDSGMPGLPDEVIDCLQGT
jgi:hypothetical protein